MTPRGDNLKKPHAFKQIKMPHVIVQLYPGKSEAQKQQLADAIVKNVTKTLGYNEESVSVAMVEIGPNQWKEKVYQKEILEKQETIFKQPGYTM